MKCEELAWFIRRKALDLTHKAKASHIASIFSIAEIISVLYTDIMKYDSKNPEWDKRDRLILSKGHAGLALYIALSKMGFFSEKFLDKYSMNGSFLAGHVSHKNVPGVEASTGSLGHGVGIAAGMALAAKRDKKKHRVFVIAGDGECNEGSVWEMAQFANHFRLNNLTLIIDHNKMQSITKCDDTLEVISLAKKFESFGFFVKEVDGHNCKELKNVLKKQHKTKPTCIIAHTIKGKGVSFMENNILWHYKDPSGDFYKKAIEELEKQKK